jgi:calcium-dependent protein kinase
MNELELIKLKETFQKIDIDNSGTITVEELEKAMHDQGFETS